LYYNVWRWYSSRSGKYDEVDPVDMPAASHPYAYAISDPINLMDPNGQIPVLPAAVPCSLSVGLKAREQGRTFGWRWAHCWASCEISKRCGGTRVAHLFGFSKEVSDTAKCLISATIHKVGASDSCWSAFQTSDFRDNEQGMNCRPKDSCEQHCLEFKNARETPPGPLFGIVLP
jgi:hypothetical protein